MRQTDREDNRMKNTLGVSLLATLAAARCGVPTFRVIANKNVRLYKQSGVEI